MNWFLIVLYLAAAAGCLWIALSYKERKLSVPATNPKEDRLYWEMMTGKFQKGFYVGSAGGLISAVGIALKYPLVAEIGCITLMAAMVFNLAFLSRGVEIAQLREKGRSGKEQYSLYPNHQFGGSLAGAGYPLYDPCSAGTVLQ